MDTEGITITVILLPPYSMYFKTRLPYKNAEIKGKSFRNLKNLDKTATFMLYVNYDSYN